MKKTFLAVVAMAALTIGACTKAKQPSVSSVTQTVNGTTWTYSASALEYSASVTDARITQSVIDNGTVQVFLKDNAGSDYAALPFTGYSNNVSITYNYTIEVGKVNLLIDASGSTSGTLPNYNFKIVVITADQRLAHPNTNWKDYNACMAALGQDI